MTSVGTHKSSSALQTKFLSSNAVAGGLAGGFARLLTSPFDVLKIRYQLQSNINPKYKNMFGSFRTIVQEEGVTALWKGNLSATYLYVAYAMVQFGVYGVFKSALDTIHDPFTSRSKVSSLDSYDRVNGSQSVPSPQWKALMLFTAGALAGIAATASTYPLDIMRTQFALQGASKYYHNIPSFVVDTWKTQGVKGFYKGMGPALIGVAPYMGLNFAIYETLHSLFEKKRSSNNNYNNNNNNSNISVQPDTVLNSAQETGVGAFAGLLKLMKSGAIGGIAGGTSKFLLFPLDTVKRRLQAQVLKSTFEVSMSEVLAGSVVRGTVYGGLSDCVRNIWKYEGIRGFYKGILPTTAKSITATAITFAAYEVSKDFLTRLDDAAEHK